MTILTSTSARIVYYDFDNLEQGFSELFLKIDFFDHVVPPMEFLTENKSFWNFTKQTFLRLSRS